MTPSDIYAPAFIRGLFDEMSATYGVTNYISSFGFTERWRKQCVDQVELRPGMTVCDLMTGMGESWEVLSRRLGGPGHLIALDFSQAMCARAQTRTVLFPQLQVDVLEED